jgi:sodium transport system permease protein
LRGVDWCISRQIGHFDCKDHREPVSFRPTWKRISPLVHVKVEQPTEPKPNSPFSKERTPTVTREPRLSSGGLRWREVRILYAREMRAALREKAIVINSILLPIFLYPFILWAAFTGIVFVQGQTEGFVSRIVASDWPKGHPGLRHLFEHNDNLLMVQDTNAQQVVEAKILDGRVDALVQFLRSDPSEEIGRGNFEARITYNESKERSETAQRHVRELMDEYRQKWLKREALAHGLSTSEWQQFKLESRNIASKKQIGAFMLSLILPVLFVVMVAVGCFYPAVDATAGERERHTWETLMSTGASRVSILTAKYLYVGSLGAIAGTLNLLAMIATIKPILAPLVDKAGAGIEFAVPLGAGPVLIIAAILMAALVAAGMMIFASFARTFKEGQAMITPFYLLVILPLMFLQVPGLTLNLPLALVPVVNLTLMVRAAVTGAFPLLPILVTVLISTALIGVCIKVAAHVLQFEDVMMGSYNGSLLKFLKESAKRRRSAPGASKAPL